jgi:hypothetical protein
MRQFRLYYCYFLTRFGFRDHRLNHHLNKIFRTKSKILFIKKKYNTINTKFNFFFKYSNIILILKQ